MKKNILKVTAVALSSMLLMTACGSAGSTPASSAAPAASTTPQAETSVYPLKTGKTIKYLCSFTSTATDPVPESLKEKEFFAEFERRTGVKISLWNFQSSDTQKVQLMLATGDLPDVMEYDWLNTYPGGPDAAMNNGVIKQLNTIMDKYAPNFKKALASRPDVDKQIKTDGGKYYAFPFIRDDSGTTYAGGIFRKDMLDELNMQAPTTIDEWYTILKAFKEKKSLASPFSVEYAYLNVGGVLSSAYGVMDGFYVENDKVVYGNIQPGYKDYLAMLRKWYSEGLMDKDFATVDKNILATKMTKGTAGATVALAGSRMGTWLTTMKDDPKYNLVGVPTPTLKKGDTPKFGQKENIYPGTCSAAITTACKDEETAARLLDYVYGKEGSMWVNYGPEGYAYDMVDGKIVFRDILTKNSDKKVTPFAATASVVGRWTNFPNFQKPTPVQYDFKQQVEAYNVWIKNDEKKYLMPPVIQTPEENEQIGKIKTQVDTLVKENQLKMIFGDKSLDAFDSYVADVKKAGIDKMIELKQKAYDRYEAR